MKEIGLAAVLGIGLMAGCGTDGGLKTATSPDYFYEQVREVRSAHAGFTAPEPESLGDSLPGRTDLSPNGQRFHHSDFLVRGHVVAAEKGEARTHTGEDEYEVVDFDDPNADERTLDVTIEVVEAYSANGVAEVGDQMTFRVGLMGAEDHEAYLNSVRALGEIVVLLETVEDGPDKGTYYPVMQAAALGQVSPAGDLEFPGMGAAERRFVGDLDTMEELRAAANR